VRLSVNLNKVATVRNSRGGTVPSVVDAARVTIEAGAPGITLHPRADARHVTFADVRDVAALLAAHAGTELNVEGDPRDDLLALVLEVRPAQCTLVPVRPGEITSQAGWSPDTGGDVERAVAALRGAGIRVSLFVEPDEEAIGWASRVGGDRVELYTEPFARAFARGETPAREAFARYAAAAEHARGLGLGVNAGHDLDLANLPTFRCLPHLDEVSIGHALISHALFVGLERSVRDYLAALAG
jgi:pyridoxine 5-phosphate synthase